jgi:hypothetical protein
MLGGVFFVERHKGSIWLMEKGRNACMTQLEKFKSDKLSEIY